MTSAKRSEQDATGKENSESSLSKSEIRRNHYRQLILDAAILLFEEQGIANTTVAEIIKQAGIAHKTFFNHFPTKNHLIEYMAVSYARLAENVFIDAKAKHRDPYRVIEFTYNTMGTMVENLSGTAREVIRDVLLNVSKFPDQDQGYRNSLENFIRAELETAKSKGKLQDRVNVGHAANVITALYTANLFKWGTIDNYAMAKNLVAELRLIKPAIFS